MSGRRRAPCGGWDPEDDDELELLEDGETLDFADEEEDLPAWPWLEDEDDEGLLDDDLELEDDFDFDDDE